MTTPWYVKSFGAAYLDLYAHRSDEEATGQIKAMLDLVKPDFAGPTLDLCCGAGRHLKALRELGMQQLTGIDLSHDLLAVAETELNGGDADSVKIIQGDMRKIPQENYYANIFSLFTSFGYFIDDAENTSVINGIYKSLKSDGYFLMDYLNRDFIIANLVPENTVQSDGYSAHNKRWITADGTRVEKKTVVTMNSGEVHEFNESVRMYSENEMHEMCESAGFQQVKIYGGLVGEALSDDCTRMIITAVK